MYLVSWNGTSECSSSALTHDLPPCEKSFAHLAAVDPFALATWIASGDLKPTQLTFAAEHMGRAGDGVRWLVVATLVPLLSHTHVYVREGAMMGLTQYAADDDVRPMFERIAMSDESETLRGMAEEILTDAYP